MEYHGCFWFPVTWQDEWIWTFQDLLGIPRCNFSLSDSEGAAKTRAVTGGGIRI